MQLWKFLHTCTRPVLSATIKSPTLYHSLEASHGSFDDSKLIFAFLVEDVNMGSVTFGQKAVFYLSVVLSDHRNTKIEKIQWCHLLCAVFSII
jgi:hypothetical protein